MLFDVAVCFFFAVEVPREARRHSAAPEWQLPAYHQVAATIESITAPDEAVLSFWPGYVFESRRRYYPDMENHFAYRVTEKLDTERRQHFHIPSRNDALEAVSKGSVKVVVLGGWMGDFYRDLSPEAVSEFKTQVDANYSPVRKIDGVTVYRSRD
jgi:hypothetical protein